MKSSVCRNHTSLCSGSKMCLFFYNILDLFKRLWRILNNILEKRIWVFWGRVSLFFSFTSFWSESILPSVLAGLRPGQSTWKEPAAKTHHKWMPKLLNPMFNFLPETTFGTRPMLEEKTKKGRKRPRFCFCNMQWRWQWAGYYTSFATGS